MILEVRAVAPFYKNGFIVGLRATREAVIIDPGDEADQLVAAVRDLDVDVRLILLTHAHIDHITGVGSDQGRIQRPGLPAPGRPVSLRGAPCSRARCSASRSDSHRRLTPTTTGRRFPLATMSCRCTTRPGTVPAGCACRLAARGQKATDLFVGDTLFAGSIGRTDLPGGDYDVLMRVDHASAVSSRRRGGRPPGAWPGHDHRARANHESVRAESRTRMTELGLRRYLKPTDPFSPVRASPRARRAPPSDDRPMPGERSRLALR